MNRSQKVLIFPIIVVFCFTFIPLQSGHGSSETVAQKVYIVQLEDQPLAMYKGDIAGLSATCPELTGADRLDIESPVCMVYRNYLAHKRSTLIQTINRELGRAVEVVFEYSIATQGLAIRVTAGEAYRIARLPGVSRVEVERIHQLHSVVLNQADGVHKSGRNSFSVISFIGLSGFFGAFLLMMSTVFGFVTRGRINSKSLLIMAIVVIGSVFLIYCEWDECDEVSEPETETTTISSMSAAWVGAPGIWDGTATGDLPGTMGEAMVIGVIDTGVDPEHPSFAETGGDGYIHTNPRAQFFGVCNPFEAGYDSTYPCNAKLIGAWDYVYGGDPRDKDGHGSHVASTAAGNIMAEVTVVYKNDHELLFDVSGVAPHANIISYTGCGRQGCPLSALLAAIDQAIADNVDVINYSIGGGPQDPWSDIESMAFLAARYAGIFVATSAGNSGSKPETVGSPANSPWLTAVGASSYDLAYLNSLTSMSGGTGSSPSDIDGRGITDGYGPASIVYAGDYGDPYCEGKFNASFSGEIVVCDNGVVGVLKKGKYVKANGGGGMVIVEIETGDIHALKESPHEIPATHIQYSDSVILKDWLKQGTGHMATISGAVVTSVPEQADIIAGFSSRGPNPGLTSIIKPEVAAPGVEVVAAYLEGTYKAIEGTSMASPHVAGTALLLKSLHPEWSAAEIQSAVMTTALNSGMLKNDCETAADLFDVGSGRLDLEKAARAGLLFDETAIRFQSADPRDYFLYETGPAGDPTVLNLPNFGNGACVETGSWTRTVKNVLNTTTSWSVDVTPPEGVDLTVTPTNFSLDPGQTQEIQISARVVSLAIDEWGFGHLTLTENNDLAPAAVMPCAIRPSYSYYPDLIEISTTSNSGSTTRYRLQASDCTDLTFKTSGLTQGDMSEHLMIADPTQGDPFDGFNSETDGTFFVLIEVPEKSKRLVAQISQSESDNIILVVGTGETASWSSVIAFSLISDPDTLEYISIENPTPGLYWVLVSNWDQENGTTTAQAVTLVTAVVPATDTDTMILEAAFTSSNMFQVTVSWNINATAGEYWYGSFDFVPGDATRPTVSVPVNLIRE
ncbi:S8 family serine peptidase [candidate division CSSED10-310 bacterium]|uniref:S8 family serine peptidase n=1 Tax=candidate division CSSED10-310 bacterium TaxID=2855610 RepID=A0ABV6YSW8_UNCC1